MQDLEFDSFKTSNSFKGHLQQAVSYNMHDTEKLEFQFNVTINLFFEDFSGISQLS